ncbi:MAG: hypothetical protein FWC91_13095 [Defluviitaleaceae bacterium]|nr:hypothetical protein [Defluviitaleaceae bacterium]
MSIIKILADATRCGIRVYAAFGLAADAQLKGFGIVKSRLIKKIESHESMLKKIKDGINGEPHNILPGTQSKLFYKALDYLDIEIISLTQAKKKKLVLKEVC